MIRLILLGQLLLSVLLLAEPQSETGHYRVMGERGVSDFFF